MNNPLRTPVCHILGCQYPVVLAGMGGVARCELVAAVTRAGGFGFLGMVREPPTLIESETRRIRGLIGHGRFGINLIPAATAPDLPDSQIETCLALAIPVVSLFWDVQPNIVRRFKDAGFIVVYQIGSVENAKHAEEAGADILIAQGSEAGGHVWGDEPLRRLVPSVAAASRLPVLAAGGIVTGKDLVEAMNHDSTDISDPRQREIASIR
jgi:nitronate monooxygenase